MIQLNTSTGEYSPLTPPFPAVQEGSLSYLPVGDMGILVYIGGDVPSTPDGISPTMTPVSLVYEQLTVLTCSELMELRPSLRHRSR